MLLEAIKLTLYDPKTQEEIKTYEQRIITFNMLSRAVGLSETLNAPQKRRRWWLWWENDLTTEQAQINALMQLVADFFGNQFTVDELKNGADVPEVMSVLKAIIARSSGISAGNPTSPRKTREKRKKTDTGY